MLGRGLGQVHLGQARCVAQPPERNTFLLSGPIGEGVSVVSAVIMGSPAVGAKPAPAAKIVVGSRRGEFKFDIVGAAEEPWDVEALLQHASA